LLGIQFQGTLYVADISGVNQEFNKVISKANELPKGIAEQFSHFSFNKKQDKNGKIMYFDNIQDFVEKLSDKDVKNISLKFRPNIENGAKEVCLSINHT
jgi:hypothetical protein